MNRNQKTLGKNKYKLEKIKTKNNQKTKTNE